MQRAAADANDPVLREWGLGSGPCGVKLGCQGSGGALRRACVWRLMGGRLGLRAPGSWCREYSNRGPWAWGVWLRA
eukprot:1795005-Pyramimonas_sp.AAC.1